MVQIKKSYNTDNDEFNFNKWLETISEFRAGIDNELFLKSYSLISNKIDKSDITFTVEITSVLLDLKMDMASCLAGMLLTAVRKNLVSLDEVSKKLNSDIAELIRGVLKMDAIHEMSNISSSDNKSEQLRKMFIAMVKDPRVVVIRLSEHLSELKYASKSGQQKQQELASETKNIYAPLANRLGIGQIKWQLEDYAFRYLESETYKSIAKLLDEKRIDRDNYIQDLIIKLEENLKSWGIEAEVGGRVKHIYSIWRKMQRKNLEFDELYDIRAVRIITNSIRDCYSALGMVHSLWQHIPHEFDDYIAMPKDNGYQSLHTAVIGPSGKIVEVQIRTHEMHSDSELGVAAHWRYKEGVHYDKSFEAKIAWLRQLVSWQDEMSSASEILEELKTDITDDRVYVITPKGDVFDLPNGATPLDLAYHIHTEVGNKCCGSKVNGKMVNLTYQLKTGDQVELLTRSNVTPSRDWLNPNFNFLKTPRARSKVQSWFRKQDYDQNVSDGKDILEKELKRLGKSNIDFSNVLVKSNYKSDDDVYAAIARGDLKLNQVLTLSGIVSQESSPKPSESIIHPDNNYDKYKAKSASSKGINIAGVDNLLTTLAGCCKPLPGNKIIGYVSQARGIIIHTDDCLNIDQIREKSPERLLEVSWGDNTENMTFAADVYIVSSDRQHFLRDLTGLLSTAKINILNLNTFTDKNGIVHTDITLEIASNAVLTGLLAKINQLPNVIKAEQNRGVG